MNWTPEQRALIIRMGNVSAQIDQVVERQRAEQRTANRHTIVAGQNLIEVAAALTNAMTSLEAAQNRSDELTPLMKQHGDLFRELLDTIA